MQVFYALLVGFLICLLLMTVLDTLQNFELTNVIGKDLLIDVIGKDLLIDW